MKIYFITRHRLPNLRGVSYGISTMCEALSRAGANVELIRPNIKSEINQSIFDFHQLTKNCFKDIKLPVVNLEITHLKQLVLSWSFAVSSVLYLMRKKAKYIHVFNEARETIFLLALFKPFFKFKIIFEVHMTPVDLYEKILDLLIINFVDIFLVTTNKFSDYYRKLNIKENKILVFPNGVNLSDFDYKTSKISLRKKLGLSTDAKIVGYGGKLVTMGMEMGVRELIYVTKQLEKKFPKLIFVCVGGPKDEVEKYKKYAFDLGISNKVIFTGDVPRKTLYEYMRCFDICAMPFPWTEHYAYNMSPLRMFEYMASKNPILATNLPSLNEILTGGKNCVMAKPGDVNDIKNKLQLLLENPSLCRRISYTAFNEVNENFTWQKRAEAELHRLSI